jgi:hypothetical protein
MMPMGLVVCELAVRISTAALFSIVPVSLLATAGIVIAAVPVLIQ